MLRLRLKQSAKLPIDARAWSPATCPDARSAAHHALRVGNQEAPAGDLFTITDEPGAADTWRLEGDLSRFHRLGYAMPAGAITVDGPVGRHCGARLRGGQLTIQGAAGDYLGAGLRSGQIRVHGDAGPNVGGAYPGEKFGMRGGEIVVFGNAGDQAGQAMRRGLLAVLGACGRQAGYRMRAGTLLVMGPAGREVGVQMLRGTIALFGDQAPELPPVFRRTCRLQPVACRLLGRQLAELAGPAAIQHFPSTIDLYHGDILRGGRGEVMTRAAG